jgi:hypothetical protein
MDIRNGHFASSAVLTSAAAPERISWRAPYFATTPVMQLVVFGVRKTLSGLAQVARLVDNCLADARLSVNQPSVVPRWINKNIQLKAAATHQQ